MQYVSGHGPASPDSGHEGVADSPPSHVASVRCWCVGSFFFFPTIANNGSVGVIAHHELQMVVGQVMETFRERIYGLSSASDEMPSPVVMKVHLFPLVAPDLTRSLTENSNSSSTRALMTGSNVGVRSQGSRFRTFFFSHSVSHFLREEI